MPHPCSPPSDLSPERRSRRARSIASPLSASSRLRRLAAAGALAAPLLAAGPAAPARAQQVVHDPTNLAQNALTAARALRQVEQQAQQLLNDVKMLARSPYSHAAELKAAADEIRALAADAKGIARDVKTLERDFKALYGGDVELKSWRDLERLSGQRLKAARDTAEDLGRVAAGLERLAADRQARVSGALAASEAAEGQTAAIQSSTQLLAVLANDLAGLQAVTAAQAQLAAQEAARAAAEREQAIALRRRLWSGGRADGSPPPPDFDPLAKARP